MTDITVQVVHKVERDLAFTQGWALPQSHFPLAASELLGSAWAFEGSTPIDLLGHSERITVDTHEARNHPELVEKLGHLVLKVGLSHLPGKHNAGGDFLIVDADLRVIAIQRKTLNDLWSSVWSGSLSDEAARMATHYNESWLLLEGGSPLDCLEEHNASPAQTKALLGTLRTLQRAYGLMVDYTTNVYETAERLLDMWDYYHSPHPDYRERQKAKKAEVSGYDAAFAGVPGWGPSLRRAVLKQYKTPLAFLEAIYGLTAGPDRDIIRVAGLGPEKMKALKGAFGEEAVVYSNRGVPRR